MSFDATGTPVILTDKFMVNYSGSSRTSLLPLLSARLSESCIFANPITNLGRPNASISY